MKSDIFSTGCSKLVFTVLKKLLAAKSMQKVMSKSATGSKKYAVCSNHNDVAKRTSSVRCQMFSAKVVPKLMLTFS